MRQHKSLPSSKSIYCEGIDVRSGIGATRSDPIASAAVLAMNDTASVVALGHRVIHTDIGSDDTAHPSVDRQLYLSSRFSSLIFHARSQAVSSLIERHAPGFVHLILSSTLTHSLFASPSRRHSCNHLIVVPISGGFKAVKENPEVLSVAGAPDHSRSNRGRGKERAHRALFPSPRNTSRV